MMTTQTSGHHQYSMQDQTPSSKWWKWMAPLTMIALPTVFEMNSGSAAIFINPKIFSYLKRNIRSCVDELKCNRQFLDMVMQMKYHFFFHIIQNKFCTRHIPCIMHEPWQSLQFCMNFNHLGVVSILHYKHMHLIIYFNPDATWLFLCTFFLSLMFNILTEMYVANSSIDVWQQYITSSIFRLHFKNSFGIVFCHLHVTMNSACVKQSHPSSHLWFTGYFHDHILCLL